MTVNPISDQDLIIRDRDRLADAAAEADSCRGIAEREGGGLYAFDQSIVRHREGDRPARAATGNGDGAVTEAVIPCGDARACDSQRNGLVAGNSTRCCCRDGDYGLASF